MKHPVVNNSKAIRQKKLKTLLNPCEESYDYNFQNCIYAKMISKIGCQPYWLDHIKTDFENCSKASQLQSFLMKMGLLYQISTEKELTDEYECLKPCNYMEYKVDMTHSQRDPILPYFVMYFWGQSV